ncbi:hypothetical protein [Thalassomonas haliotis]|uniref:Uncharacterized protein n=1 Tax=Thalassomonas haliotis TaxID=485448 RepID=A0ABY7VI83_9GAMM|nr:hypothetical protein [Thalassomonas haliotis]WDE12731.1 hypothetical protein H3N35_04475 [Thalassomonas haliotis]
MNDCFLKRLENHVLANRKIYTWGKALGVSSGAVDKLLKGAVPGIDIQLSMQHKENCNLTFLNTGKGKPFNVNNFPASQGMIDYVAELLATAPWNIYIVRADNLITLVFQQPGQYEYKTKLIDHDVCEVLVGQYTEAVYKYLSTKLEHNKVYYPKLSEEVIEQITSGYLGTFALFGDKKTSGILNHLSQATAVLDQLPSTVASEQNTADSHLMRAVIRLIEQAIVENRIELSVETRAKVITAGYNYAVRTGSSVSSLDPHGILAILDTIVE